MVEPPLTQFGSVVIANMPELLEPGASAEGPRPGQIGGAIFSMTDAQLGLIDLPGDASASEVMDAMLVDLFGDGNDTITFDSIQTIDLNDQPVVVASGRSETVTDDLVDLLAFVSQPDGRTVFSLFGISQVDTDQFDIGEVFAVVAGMRVDTGDDATAAIDLPQTITSASDELGTLTVRIPEDYFGLGLQTGVLVANSERLLELLGADADLSEQQVEPGQFGLTMAGFPPEYAAFFGIDPGGDLEEALITLMTDVFLTEGESFEIIDSESGAFGDYPGAWVTGQVIDGDVVNETAVILMDLGDSYVLMVAVAAEGTIGDYLDVLRAIAASVEYTPPDE